MGVPLETLLADIPKVHRGRTVTWGVLDRVARILHDRAAGAVTLETGSGLSTIVLLNAGVQKHISVQPDAGEFEAIREYCASHAIDDAPLIAVVAESQSYLPSATLPPLDLVLIDGAHAFPVPFIDYHFASLALKVGGILIVDDIHIATGTILADFLASEPCWETVERDVETRRFAAFRLKEPLRPRFNDWLDQPYLAACYPTRSVNLVKSQPKGPVERVAARVLPWRIQHKLRERFGWPRPTWG